MFLNICFNVNLCKVERTLFAVATGVRIIRYDLSTRQETEIYIKGGEIRDLAILQDKLLFVDKSIGIQAIQKDSKKTVALAQSIHTTGLDECSSYTSLHVYDGR